MKLTPEQEAKVKNYVDQQELAIETLRDDLVDHLCCVIESKLGKNRVFDDLLHEAINDLAPNGLKELEQETVFLLNSKRIIIMKKLMYLIGFIGSLILTAGFLFTILHWQGGNQLFITGFLILLLIFIPLFAFDRYKVAISKALTEKLKIILGVTASVIAGLSGVFKVMHLQGADILLIVGAFVFAFGFLPFFFFTMYRKAVS